MLRVSVCSLAALRVGREMFMSNLRREKIRCSAFCHVCMVCTPLPCHRVGGSWPLCKASHSSDFQFSLTRSVPLEVSPVHLPVWEAAERGFMDTASLLPTLCISPLGSVTWISVPSGSSAIFSVGIQSLQNLSSMSKRDMRCLTTVSSDTLLAKCGTSAHRCLNFQNGSLVLKTVEKEDEGKYEFVFYNTTRVFTLQVFGK